MFSCYLKFGSAAVELWEGGVGGDEETREIILRWLH